MKLYLSSYRLGNYTQELKNLVLKQNVKVAVCVNALDYADNKIRNEKVLRRELSDMRSLGFISEELDLRDYFDNDGLTEKMKEYDILWVSGGNVFLLMKAFLQSGFDRVFDEQIKNGDLVYAGYSAAFCILTSSFSGMELVDDKDIEVEGYDSKIIWEGFGAIDFYPIVHFRSNHHESDLVEKEYEYVCKNDIPHKTFRDGDVYIVNGNDREVLSD